MDHVSSSLASTARANSPTTNQCSVCKLGPSGLVRPLILCAACHRHWHSYCHNPPISFSGTNQPWHCARCSKKMASCYEVKCASAHCTKKIPAEGVDSKVYCFLCEKRKAHEEAKRVIPKPDTYAFPAFSRAISPPSMRREGSSKRGYSSSSNAALEAKRPRLMRSLPQASPTRISSEAGSLVKPDEIHSRKAVDSLLEQPCSIPKRRAPFTASYNEPSSFDKGSPLEQPLSTRGGSVTASSNELPTLNAPKTSMPIPFGSRNIKGPLKKSTPKSPAKTGEPISASVEDRYTAEQPYILDKDDDTRQWNVNISSQDVGEGRVASSNATSFETSVRGSIEDRSDDVNSYSSIRTKEQVQHLQAFNNTVPEGFKEQLIVPEIGTINSILPDTILNQIQSELPGPPPQDAPFWGYLSNVAQSSSFALNEGIRRLSISSEIVEGDEVHDAKRNVAQDIANVSEPAKLKSNMVDSSTQTDIAFSVDSHLNLLPSLVDKEPEDLDALMEDNQGVFNDLISMVSSRSAALDAFLYNQSAMNPSNVQFFHIDPRKSKGRINRIPATCHESKSLSRSRLKEDYHGERLTSPDIEAKEKRGWSRHQETNKSSIPPLEARALLQDFGLPENLEPILRDGELVMSEVIPSRRKSRNAARRIWRIPK